MSQPGTNVAGAAPEEGPAVFLSYGRADDEPFVEELHRHLAEHGLRVWWDRADMPSRALTFLQEIRDAIARSERLVLVAGPAALRSDYVRAEWQYALALSKPVIPVLRVGRMGGLPPEVGRVHCVDARAARPAEEAFDEIMRVLGEPLPPLGAFLTPVPALPAFFQPRTDEMGRLAGLLLEDQARPVTVTGQDRVVVVHGLPGMGKSVLAAAFARSTGTRRSFPDGVLWLAARDVQAVDPGTLLGGDGTAADDARAVLVVIDDATQLVDVEPVLNMLGSRGRVLVTTRNAGLARSLGAHELSLGALAPDATLRQLADWAGSSVQELPAAAHEVAKWSAGLPFAAVVCGAMARAGRPWDDLLDALQEADLGYLAHEVPNYSHISVLACLAVAVEGLPEADAELLADLRVFPRGVPIADALVLRLWARRRQLSARAARDTLARLAERALLRWEGDPRTVALHALEHDLLRARGPDAEPLHGAIVEMYRQDCPAGWASGPNDGYFFEWLLHHLAGSGDDAGVDRLMFDPAWMQSKLRAVGLYAVIADYRGDLSDDPEAEREVRQALLHAATAIQSAPDHLAALLADRLHDPVRRASVELAERLRGAVPRPSFQLLSKSVAEQSGGSIATMRTSGRHLHAVVMLAGNERFATASGDDVLRIHALDTGRLVDQARASGELQAACALPEGRHVATIARPSGGEGTVLELYDMHERALRPIGRSDEAELTSICALADGTLVCGGRDGTLTHWDPMSTVPLRRWRESDEHRGDGVLEGTIETVLALPGGDRVASLMGGRWLSVWNVRTAKLEWTVATESLGAIAATCGASVAVVLHDRVTFHDAETGALQRQVEIELPGLVTAFALDESSMTAVWATQISSWRFFVGRAELYAGSLADEHVQPALCGTHDIRVEAMAMDASGAVLASGSLDGMLRLWDLRRAAHGGGAPAAHRDRVTALELIDRERKLLSSSQDGTVKLWRTTDGMPLRDIPTSSPSEHVTSVAAIDRSRIVYSQADGYAYVVDLKSGRQLWSRRVHRYGVGVVAAAPVIRGFLTGDRYGWVDAWTEGGEGWESRRLGTPGDVVHGILLPAGGRHALAWDRSRQRMAAYDLLADDRQELVWNALFTGWDAAVLGLPDDRCAFPTPDDDGHAIAGVSVTSGERLFTLAGFDDVVTSLAATPGADTLAVGMQDGSVALCNVAADTSPMRLVGHAGPVVALRFFSERLLLSASLDFTLRLWDVTNAQALAVFGADGPLHRLIVTASGHRVIVTELSGRMHVLHIQPGDSAATAR